MRPKPIWAVQSFLISFLWNAVLLVVLYYMADEILQGFGKWVSPFLKPGGESLPNDVRTAFASLGEFANEMRFYLAPVVFGLGVVVTMIIWLSLFLLGCRFARRAALGSAASPVPPDQTVKEEKKGETKEPAAPESYTQPYPQSAVQMLSILQKDGRLIDFLYEDLGVYDDAQIGAAVRSIHQGCKDALNKHVELKPVLDEGEGDEITVPAGFDAGVIRLTGNIAGDPPFRGILRHRGWRATRVELPLPTSEKKDECIVAPAEVEIGGNEK
ncbi:MAG: DUF2760 domain-containing protein [Syntrophobacteraceae bacterium]